MGSILQPGYVRWDGFKYVLDPSVEIVGPLGPPGPAGSNGTIGLDGDATLIYRPGGTTSGNVYASWTALMAKRATIQSPMTVVIDDSITSPAPIDTGVWDLTNNTAIVGAKGNQLTSDVLTQLIIPDGAQLVNPNYFADLEVIGHSFGAASIDGDLMNFAAYNVTFHTSGTGVLIHTAGGVIDFYGTSHLVSSNSAAFIISNQSVTPVTINLHDQTVVDGYTLHFSDSQYQVVVNVMDAATFDPSNQPGISIPIVINEYNIVQSVSFANNANPTITTIRPLGFNSPTDGTLPGSINLHTTQQGFPYNNGPPLQDGVAGSYSAILSGTNNSIGLANYCAVVSGSANFIQHSPSQGPPDTSTILGGRDNTMSQPGSFNSIIGGENNNLTGSSSSFIAGRNSSIGGSVGCFLAGHNNSMNGATWSIIAGGIQNSVVGFSCGTLAGQNNTAGSVGGAGAVVLGGDQCSASGNFSAVICGEQSSATADYSFAIGYHAFASRVGQIAHGLGPQFGFGSGFAGQFSNYLVGGSTNSSTPIILSDQGGGQLTLENGKTYAIKATCIATRVGVSGRFMFIHTLLAHATAGTAVIDNDNLTLSVPNGQPWTITYSVSANAIVATFTPNVNESINVVVTYEFSEVGGGV